MVRHGYRLAAVFASPSSTLIGSSFAFYYSNLSNQLPEMFVNMNNPVSQKKKKEWYINFMLFVDNDGLNKYGSAIRLGKSP